MSDSKLKMPDFNELTSMAAKLFKDLKTSVNEIIDNYKEKREQENTDSTVVHTKDKETVIKKESKPKKNTTETTKTTTTVDEENPDK